MPALAERDSGMFDRNTAMTTARPTEPPPRRLTPIAADSGIPSSRAPRTRAVDADPDASSVPVGSLRSAPPLCSSTQSPPKNVMEPAASPRTTGHAPDRSYAAPVSSKATALMSTPTPNPMTSPTIRSGTAANSPMSAPMSSEPPPTKPQNAASSTSAAFPAEPGTTRPIGRPVAAGRSGVRLALTLGEPEEVEEGRHDDDA